MELRLLYWLNGQDGLARIRVDRSTYRIGQIVFRGADREGAMKVKYATIIVRSMDESIEFYSDVMGFEVDSQFKPLPGVVITLMKGPGEAMVELIENGAYEVGLYSVGMDVDDLEATVERLKAKGAMITMEPVPTQVGSLAFVEDPNGARIALVEHR